MVRVVVAFHSGFGHTEAIARSVAKGASIAEGMQEEGVTLVDVSTLPAPDQDAKTYPDAWRELLEADAVIFGSPTYMGSVSGPFKVFMDHTSAVWFAQRWKDRVAGGFTCASSLAGDKLNTLITMSVFAAQHSMIWVGTGQLPQGREETSVNRMGSFLGLMAQADFDKAPDVHPPEGDHESARLYGARVAGVAVGLRGGGEGE